MSSPQEEREGVSIPRERRALQSIICRGKSGKNANKREVFTILTFFIFWCGVERSKVDVNACLRKNTQIQIDRGVKRRQFFGRR